MLFAGRGNNSRLAAACTRHPGECLEHPICKSKSRTLKSDLGQAPDIAEAAAFRLDSVLQEFNLDGNAARCRMRNLSSK
jgi:hypothetical protein